MSGSTRAITLTLSVRDADSVKQSLQQIGPAGEQALARLEAAAQKAAGRAGGSGGMRQLAEAAQQAETRFTGVGQKIGQAGFQIQDFAVQVQGGTSALTALSQQGSQLLGVFGTGGAIAGAVLTVSLLVSQILLGRDATKAWDDAIKEQEASLKRVTDEAQRWRDGLDREATQVQQMTQYYNSLSEARRGVEMREVLRQQGTLNDREAVLRRDIEGNVGALATGARDQLTQARDYARASYPAGSVEQRAALDALDNSDAARRLSELIDVYDRFRSSGSLTVEGVAQLSAALRVLGQENDNVGGMARRAADAMERQLPGVRELEGAQRDLTARSHALGVATTGLASGVDLARTSFERLRDVVLSNPFRGLDAQIASASERMGALARGGIALYEGLQSIQGEQERGATLFRTWESGRRQELERAGGLSAQQIQERIDAESPDARMRAMQAANLGRVETTQAAAAREAARKAEQDALRNARSGARDAQREQREAERDAQAAMDAANRADTQDLRDYAAALRAVETPMERYTRRVEELSELQVRLQEAGTPMRPEDDARIFEAIQKELADAESRTNGATSAARELGMTFSSAFEDAIIKGKALSDVLKGVAEDLARIILRQAVVNPLAGAASSAATAAGNYIGSLFGPSSPATAAGGGYSTGNIGASYGAGFANGGAFASGRLIPFAAGGMVDRATVVPMALMGEAGPEAIMPLRRGKDGKLGVAAAGGGGPSVTQNITIDARGADPTVIPLIRAAMAETERRTIATLTAQVQRGGQAAKTFGRRT